VRLVARHIADYFATRRLVIDYFAYAARLGASARHAARHAARHRLLRPRCASVCLGTSRGSSSTTSPTLRIRGASARRAPRRRLVHLTQARRQPLRLRHASGFHDTSCGSLRGSSSTTSPRAGLSLTTSHTPLVRMPRHVTRLVARLVADYFAHAACPGASARRAARRRLLHLHCASEGPRHVVRLVID
jgi:hypothetical protein